MNVVVHDRAAVSPLDALAACCLGALLIMSFLQFSAVRVRDSELEATCGTNADSCLVTFAGGCSNKGVNTGFPKTLI